MKNYFIIYSTIYKLIINKFNFFCQYTRLYIMFLNIFTNLFPKKSNYHINRQYIKNERKIKKCLLEKTNGNLHITRILQHNDKF